MRYFEFNQHAYYGLVGANDVEAAKVKFYETVCDEEEDDGEPDEISREQAKEKHEKACKICPDWKPSDPSFEEMEQQSINGNYQWLVLIDGALLN